MDVITRQFIAWLRTFSKQEQQELIQYIYSEQGSADIPIGIFGGPAPYPPMKRCPKCGRPYYGDRNWMDDQEDRSY